MTVLLISLFVGLFSGMTLWFALRVIRSIPVQDRSFLDKPPIGFALTWPLIQLLGFYCSRFITQRSRLATTSRLERAGVEFSVSVEQFFASKLLCACCAGVFAYVALFVLQRVSFVALLLLAISGFFYPELWLKETVERRAQAILRALPFYLDVITLAIESGTNLTGGITQAVQKSPEGPLKSEFSRVLRDIRAGKARANALRDLSSRVATSALTTVISSMIQAERSGANLGPVLRAQSEQLRNQRFLRAEKKAMEAPVKLIGPLVLFIFPTTFLVIGFVILSKALQAQLITWPWLVWAYHWPG